MTEIITTKVVSNEQDLNRDPITGTPGAHPLGTGTGAASGGVAGAVCGRRPPSTYGPSFGLEPDCAWASGGTGAAAGAIDGGAAGETGSRLQPLTPSTLPVSSASSAAAAPPRRAGRGPRVAGVEPAIIGRIMSRPSGSEPR